MKHHIQALATEYAGHTFRSREEARWAVAFDKLGVAWEYEANGYQLRSGRYLPDFMLRGIGAGCDGKGIVFFEVKPDDPTERVYDERWPELATYTGYPLYVAHGLPRGDGVDTLTGDSRREGFIELFAPDGSRDGPMAFAFCHICGRIGITWEGRSDTVCVAHEEVMGANDARILSAYRAAHGERFEVGAARARRAF